MKKAILLLVILFSSTAFCQNESFPGKPFIEVTGTAEKDISPDKIYISIKLTDKSNDNKYSITEQEVQLKSMLQRIGIDLNNLTLSNMDSEILSNKKKEIGLKLTKEFTLLVKNSNEVSKVFQELYKLNIKEANIAKTENSKIEEYRKEVRISALKAAKEKAEYLLAAIGQQIDKPLEIKENQNNFYNLRASSNMIMNQESPVESEFEKFTIKFSYTVKYGIK